MKNTADCLADFFETYDRQKSIAVLCEFTNSSKYAATSWANKKCSPKGFALMRVRTFLQLIGQSVSESSVMNAEQKALSTMIGLGLVEAAGLAKEINISDNSLRDYLVRGQSMSKFHTHRVRRIVENNEATVDELTRSISADLKAKLGNAKEKNNPPIIAGQNEPAVSPPSLKDASLENLWDAIECARTLVDVTDSVSLFDEAAIVRVLKALQDSRIVALSKLVDELIM